MLSNDRPTFKTGSTTMSRVILDKTIHSETRLAILTMLRRAGAPVEFTALREDLSLSGGNLLSHLRALEQGGVVQHLREAPLGRPRTVYWITPDGEARLKTYAAQLREIASVLENPPVRSTSSQPLAT